MSVRRWLGVVGMVLAVGAGTAATVANEGFEAQVFLELEKREPRGVPAPRPDGPETLLDSPHVSNLVRLRLGETPPVRVSAVTHDTVLVRSRGATPEQATKATETYAASYVEVRRRQIEAEAEAAAEQVRQKVSHVESQLIAAEEPQRTALVGLLGLFNQQMDRLQAGSSGPAVVGSTSAHPVADMARAAWLVAALGGALCVGAALSALRAGRRTPTEPGG